MIRIAMCAGLLAAGSAPASAANGSENVPRFGHVFVIVGENTTYSHLTSATPLPARNHQAGVGLADPVLRRDPLVRANYVALTSGQFTGSEQEDGGAACHHNVDARAVPAYVLKALALAHLDDRDLLDNEEAWQRGQLPDRFAEFVYPRQSLNAQCLRDQILQERPRGRARG
jgi:hypothetical protein